MVEFGGWLKQVDPSTGVMLIFLRGLKAIASDKYLHERQQRGLLTRTHARSGKTFVCLTP